MNLSAVILTKDEENNIKECIDCLDFCDEVIVVDDSSSDKTTGLAEKLDAKVYKRKLGDNFAAQRNFGLKKATGTWVLFIDADERVTEDLRNEIVQMTNDPLVNYLGFYLKRVDYIWGKRLKHGETANIKLLRLARRKAGKWRRRVHEVWDIEGRTRELKNPLIHYPHPTLADFITSVNIMSNLHAKANLEEGKKSSLVKIIIWPIGKFASNFILKVGFLDGIQGFIVALVMSFHSYLAWSKLWFLQRKI
jgi:glycosyltransferase involved in cell wall biosynthesis